MADNKVALQLRLSVETHRKLKEISELELRSLNAQIEYFLLKGIERFEWEQEHQFDHNTQALYQSEHSKEHSEKSQSCLTTP